MSSSWIHYGQAGHFCHADKCCFHLHTNVGKYIISTIGGYYPNDPETMEEIGYHRLYETMVFPAGELCECGCGVVLPASHSEIDSAAYHDARSANEGHVTMCRMWSGVAVQDYGDGWREREESFKAAAAADAECNG